MRGWLRTWLLLIALGYPAGLLILLVHEAIGHGVVAEILGGRFLALYLSPAVGFADFFAPPGAATLAALGAAAPLAALVGLAVWARTRGSAHLLPRVAGWYFGLGGVANVAAWGLFPWILARRGTFRGDWAEVWHAWRVPPAIPAILALAPLAILSGLLLADARRLVEALHPGRRGLVGPFLLVASAGAVPKIAYVLSYWPWWRTLDRSLLAGIVTLPLGVFAGGLIGWPIVRWRGWDEEPVPLDPGETRPAGLRPPRPMAAIGWAGLLLLATVGVAFLFGPATRLRKGLAIRDLTRDDYAEVGNTVRIEWAFDAEGRGTLTILSGRPVSPDSPFDEARADDAEHLGPSREACWRLVAHYAATMPEVQVGEATADGDRAEGRWRCVAEATATGRALRVVIPDGPQTVTLRAPGLATRLRTKEGYGLTLSEGTARWDRPTGFDGTDEFTARF